MKVLVAAITLLISMTSFAQDSVAMILDNYFENIGGREALRDVKGAKMTAEVDAQGMTIPIEMYQMTDGRTITRFEVMGMSMAQGAFDGEVAWSTNFMTQKAEKMEAEDAENMKRDIGNFPSAFLDYEDKGFTVEYVGTGVADGVDCFKVKLTKKTILVEGEEKENVEYYYFDQESFVPVMSESEMMSGPSAGEIAITAYSDYQEVEGIYFPFSITYRTEDSDGQTIEMDTVELNPEIEEGFFSFPEDTEEE